MSRERELLHFRLLGQEEQRQAIHRLAVAGMSDATIAAATALSVEQVRRTVGQRASATEHTPPRTCSCGADAPELRRCATNNAVGWQCSVCGSALSSWIPHRDLRGVNAAELPNWHAARATSLQSELL